MKNTARAAARLGVSVVNGFTGSSIWHLVYSFPPVSPEMIDAGYRDFAKRWRPILDVFREAGIRFALEVHPTEIAFDISSAERTLAAIEEHPSFGFNFDPSHFGYQGVDYAGFIERFGDRIFHAHMKDVWWSSTPRRSGVFGGHLPFGHRDRGWEFRSIGRGRIDFEEVIRSLNRVGYQGPLSVEWEDAGMDREFGAREACARIKAFDFAASDVAFDAAFERK
jgi:sugar phosphate isomerase/epimerase